jgi:hypothetical protein
MPKDVEAERLVPNSALQVGGSQADYRERMALLRAEALERRQRELNEQRSPLNAPPDRIRIWERLHQLPLPRSPEHRLLDIIAADTGLSLEEVQAEQRLRSVAKAAGVTG